MEVALKYRKSLKRERSNLFPSDYLGRNINKINGFRRCCREFLIAWLSVAANWNDKLAEQIKKKEAHKKRLLEAKKRRRSTPDLSRAEPSKPEKADVCEGEVTEPSYFQQFRLSSATIKAVGEGYNTVTLVQRAIELSREAEYDQVWCVFDKDDFPAQDFNNVIQIAEASGMKVAYSNQAFEY